MKIFEQRSPPAVRIRSNAVQLGMERIREFVGARVVHNAGSPQHGSRRVAQILLEMRHEKFPGGLNPKAASAGERQILEVQRT